MRTLILFLVLLLFIPVGCSRHGNASVPETPDKATVLEAAKSIAAKTHGPDGPVIDAADVDIKGTSRDGANCVVVAEVRAVYLPAFKKLQGYADLRGAGFTSWFATVDFERQRKKNGIRFAKVKFQFRLYDTGWLFEGLESK